MEESEVLVEWVTYRLANGDPIWGEYAFVTGTEFFEDVADETEVIKETWLLKETETITVKPFWWSDDEEEED